MRLSARSSGGLGMSSDLILPSGWTAVPLQDLTDGTPITYGVVQPGTLVPVGVPMLRVNNFRGFGLDTGEVLNIDPAIEAKYGRTRLRENDVLTTIVGSVGQVAVVPKAMAGWNIARAVALVRPKDENIAYWIALCLRSPAAQHALGIAANTTVQTTINLKDLRSLQVPLPPVSERQEIVETIRSIDEQIELVRETNATLEAIAQAIFKSWFIDFDPVKAKSEGRIPDGIDADTAALFPDSFEESALGAIPKGWRAGKFGDLARLAKGTINPLKEPDREFDHYSLPAFDNGARPVQERGRLIKSNKTPFFPGAVLQSKLNPHIPRVWFAPGVSESAVCSTEFLPWVATQGSCNELIYCLLCSDEFSRQVQTLVNGTSNSHQRIKPDLVAGMSVVISDNAVVRAFEEVAAPLMEQVKANIEEAATLAELRDTLLPRLISGKLKLPELHEVAETL